MPPQDLWVATVVAALLQEDEHHRLLHLEPALAELALGDGSRAFVIAPRRTPDEVEVALRELVAASAPVHLQIVFCGAPELRAVLERVVPRWTNRRMIQVFHQDPRGDVWWGRTSREQAPMIATLRKVAARSSPSLPVEELVRRCAPPPSPEERAAIEEQRARWAEIQARPRRVSRSFVAGLAVMFGLELLWGGAESVPTLVRMGANTAASLAGEPYRLLASVNLHYGVLHAAVNGFVLFWLGGDLERWIGGARLALLLVAAGLGGALASAGVGHAAISVGASGAIWGLLGAAAGLSLRPRAWVPAGLVRPLRRATLANLAINLGVSFVPGIDLWAHLGGGVVGLLVAISGLWGRGDRLAPSWPTRVAAVSAVALLVGSSAWSIVRHRPWELREPLAWREHVVGDVRFAAPVALGDLAEDTEGITIGRPLEDPMTMSIVVTPLSEPPTAEDRAGWNAYAFPVDEADGVVEVGRTVVAPPPHPAFEVVLRGSNGLWWLVRSALGEDVRVQIEVVSWDERATIDAPRRMADSVIVASPGCAPEGCRWAREP